MILFEKISYSIANAFVVHCDWALCAADDTIFVFIRFIVLLKGLHEESRSLLSCFSLLLSIGLMFLLFNFVCGRGRGCCCFGNSRMLDLHTIIECCQLFLLTPSIEPAIFCPVAVGKGIPLPRSVPHSLTVYQGIHQPNAYIPGVWTSKPWI